MKYELKEPVVDILKITSSDVTYTLEDGSTKTLPSLPVTGQSYIVQTDTVISDADLASEYVAVPLS